jgi:hypothetical protein
MVKRKANSSVNPQKQFVVNVQLQPTPNPSSLITHNHLECFYHLSNKKALLYNLKAYYDALGDDVFTVMPITFHIKDGIQDKEFIRFMDFYNQIE